jgi:predicted enzyme related to lactoylglutathione lyase
MLRLWLIVVLTLAGALAPSRADARVAETCAQGFFATAMTARQESEPQVAGSHQSFAACGYESASGYSQAAESGAGGLGPVLQGQQGVATAIQQIEGEGGQVLGSEITIDAGGVRARPDLLIQDAEGNLQFVEVKTGGGTLTPNQQTVYPLIEQGGAVPAGGNAAAAGLTPGVPLPPTPVRVIYLPGPGG